MLELEGASLTWLIVLLVTVIIVHTVILRLLIKLKDNKTE
jgi:hypothetical protein